MKTCEDRERDQPWSTKSNSTGLCRRLIAQDCLSPSESRICVQPWEAARFLSAVVDCVVVHACTGLQEQRYWSRIRLCTQHYSTFISLPKDVSDSASHGFFMFFLSNPFPGLPALGSGQSLRVWDTKGGPRDLEGCWWLQLRIKPRPYLASLARRKPFRKTRFEKTRQTSDRDQKTDQLGERCGTGRSWFSYVFMCSYDVFVCFYMFL